MFKLERIAAWWGVLGVPPEALNQSQSRMPAAGSIWGKTKPGPCLWVWCGCNLASFSFLGALCLISYFRDCIAVCISKCETHCSNETIQVTPPTTHKSEKAGLKVREHLGGFRLTQSPPQLQMYRGLIIIPKYGTSYSSYTVDNVPLPHTTYKN